MKVKPIKLDFLKKSFLWTLFFRLVLLKQHKLQIRIHPPNCKLFVFL